MNAQVRYRLGAAHLLTGGYEFERENYAFDFADASDPGAASAVNATQKSNALFVQDQTRWFGGRLVASAGFRAQFFTLDRPAAEPGVVGPFQGIAFAAPRRLTRATARRPILSAAAPPKLRAHVGRRLPRSPSLYERFGTGFDSFFGYTTYGDPRLAPEHSITFDAASTRRSRKRVRASRHLFLRAPATGGCFR